MKKRYKRKQVIKMRKKIFFQFLAITIILATITVNAATKPVYEMWVESPYITSGITVPEMSIIKAVRNNEVELFKLDSIGPNIYLAACESKGSSRGKNSNQSLSYISLYTLALTGSEYIIIDGITFSEEYYYDCSIQLNDLTTVTTGLTDSDPYYMVTPQGKYTSFQYGWGLWDEYAFISKNGKIGRTNCRVVNFEGSRQGSIKNINGKISYFETMFYNNDRNYGSLYYYPNNDDYKGNVNGILFDASGTLFTYYITSYHVNYYGTISSADATVVNNFGNRIYASTNIALQKKENIFPDGRKVEVKWQSVGDGIYELWYIINNADGTRRAVGPTGYSAYFGGAFNTYPISAIAINNSKFITYVNAMGNDWYNEYYRVAVVEETLTGEIDTGADIGTKNITPPNTADTIPINPQIDFGENDLPLGYNLNPTIKSDINTILLPDIVIVKKAGYISGVTNTGQSLGSLSSYDYGLGSSYIRFYTNGSNFQYYCYNPENLTVGIYNKSFVIGAKTIYIKVKIIAPPTNNGTTTSVFF
jgi:hypothetical protein